MIGGRSLCFLAESMGNPTVVVVEAVDRLRRRNKHKKGHNLLNPNLAN